MSDDTVQDAPPVPVPPPAEPAEKPDVDDDADDDSVTERYRVPQDLYDSLLSVGFSSNAIKKSIIAGCIDEKTCMQWLEMHLDHPELNTAIEPHIRVTVVKKRVLTDEERAAKIAELKQKIQQNKVLEAQSLKAKSAEDEKRRVEEGKAAMIAKANREAAQRKLDYEQRRREKEQDRITKERLQFELAVDRFVRLGHSREEATVKAKQEFEEKAAKVAEERARREEADRAEREARERSEAARQSSRAAGGGGGGGGGWDLSKFVQGAEPDSVNDAPSSSGAQVVVDFDRDEITSANPTVDDFTAILSRSASLLGASNEPRAVTGRQILHRVLKAIALAPLDRKVRTLKVTSAVFTQKLIPMPLACYFLRQAGFQEASSTPELAAAGVSDLFTMHAFVSRRVENALTALQQAGV